MSYFTDRPTEWLIISGPQPRSFLTFSLHPLRLARIGFFFLICHLLIAFGTSDYSVARYVRLYSLNVLTSSRFDLMLQISLNPLSWILLLFIFKKCKSASADKSKEFEYCFSSRCNPCRKCSNYFCWLSYVSSRQLLAAIHLGGRQGGKGRIPCVLTRIYLFEHLLIDAVESVNGHAAACFWTKGTWPWLSVYMRVYLMN